MAEDPNSTTTFEAQLPGGAKIKISSRSMQIFVWISVAGVLGYGAATIWKQTINIDLVLLVQRETLRQVREINCALSLTEEERKAHPSVLAACKASGEIK